MRQGGLYISEKGDKAPKRVEGTREHELGNRIRDADGLPVAPMRREQEAPRNTPQEATTKPGPEKSRAAKEK